MKGEWITVNNLDFGKNSLPENYYIVKYDNGKILYYDYDLNKLNYDELSKMKENINEENNIQVGSGKVEDLKYGFITRQSIRNIISRHNKKMIITEKNIEYIYSTTPWSLSMSARPIDIVINYFHNFFLVPNFLFPKKVIVDNIIDKMKAYHHSHFWLPNDDDDTSWDLIRKALNVKIAMASNGKQKNYSFVMAAMGKRVMCINTNCYRVANLGPSSSSTKQRQECIPCTKRVVPNKGILVTMEPKVYEEGTDEIEEEIKLDVRFKEADIIYNSFDYCVNNRYDRVTGKKHDNPIKVILKKDRKKINPPTSYLVDDNGNPFFCPISRKIYPTIKGIYQVDHIDGNHFNNTKENIQDLCSVCHEIKGALSGDKAVGKKVDDALTTHINTELGPYRSVKGQRILIDHIYNQYHEYCKILNYDEHIKVGKEMLIFRQPTDAEYAERGGKDVEDDEDGEDGEDGEDEEEKKEESKPKVVIKEEPKAEPTPKVAIKKELKKTIKKSNKGKNPAKK